MRYNPKIDEGLTKQQVKTRKSEHLVNYDTSLPTKTIKAIIRDNICTLFNFLNFALALAIILVGSYKNLLFLGVVICNIIISTIQEIRSKLIVDKLSVIASSKTTVIREKQQKNVNNDEIVLDDIIVLKMGNQIVTDSIIKEGSCEVDESFITGESETVYKKQGDMLLSGSFIVSGKCIAQVEHVGIDNYTAKISKEAKNIKTIKSEIMKSINQIIKFISIAIVPIGILLFLNQINIVGNTLENAVVNTVAALISMIPEGLVLLTSTVLAVSVVKLSKYNVLVQQLYCIEALARVDTICFDKTGTLTEGKMEIDNIILKNKKYNLEEIIKEMCFNLEQDNKTIIALEEKFGKSNNYIKETITPFSSERKWSSVTFKNKGSFILGAPDVILKETLKTNLKEIEKYSKENRVIALAHTNKKIEKKLPKELELIGFIILKDKIRKEALKTINYFKNQGVDIKIISGDNAITVKNIAKRIGLDIDKYIDTTNISKEKLTEIVEKYSIFGRVTPQGKKTIIKALQDKGHTVAMTGDGVNDVLALKEADCSVALASGSDAARNVSELVLLDSNFDSMPQIVKEGRRTINNMERSASLFIIKTIYSSLLAIIFIFVNLTYPFIPIQLTLTSCLTIGIPSFVLALESNDNKVSGNFFIKVVSSSIPTALTVVSNILIVIILGGIIKLSQDQISTLAVILTGFVGFVHIYRISLPLNKLRFCLLTVLSSAFIIGIVGLKKLFSLTFLTPYMIIILALLIINTFLIINTLTYICKNHIYKYIKKLSEK